MDIKSMAKSKRSHTQHHHPKKPHHPPKTTTSSSSSNATSAKKESRDRKKATQPSPPSLPSNWDRYEDEQDFPIHSDSDSSTQFDASKSVDADVVKPKSKGADFSYLIAQAKESRSYYSPSFDHNLPEFYQGVAPMFAVRGEKIILQDRDDDFFMEDEGNGTQEASFLTLDLEDIAERLSKVDIAKRLFIEPDLFPPELHGKDASEADKEASFQRHERRKMERIDSFGELLALYLEEERIAKRQEDINKDGTLVSSNDGDHHDPNPKLVSDADLAESKFNDMGFIDSREAGQVNYGREKDSKRELDDEGQVSTVPKQVIESKLLDSEVLVEREVPHVIEEDIGPSSRFEAATAEAELDMLLGSFNDTKLFDTPMNQPGTSASYLTGTIATPEAPLKHSLGQCALAFSITSSLDDELDDLLAETSNLNNKHDILKSTQVPSSSLSQPSSNSKVLDDFDSWMDTL